MHKVNLKVAKSEHKHNHKRPLSRRQRLLSVFLSSFLITSLLFLLIFVVYNTGNEQPVIVADQGADSAEDIERSPDNAGADIESPTAAPSIVSSDSPAILQLDPVEPTTTPVLPINADNQPQIVAQKENFTANEVPQFELDYSFPDETSARTSTSYLESTSIIELPGYRISAEILDGQGNSTNLLPILTLLPDGHFFMSLQAVNSFKPGAYTLQVKVREEGFAEFELEQDFTWGVFAINTPQDSYAPGDEVDLHMTVLDDQGATICNADIEMNILSPSGTKYSFSTIHGTITRSADCAPDNVTYTPDFLAHLTEVYEEGTYSINALVDNNQTTREFTSSFIVRTDQEFTIHRNSATRIYPPSSYKMDITIHSSENFVGIVSEYLPADFEILGEHNIEVFNNYQALSFPVAIDAGGETTISYAYDAPDISPEFYLAGPLELKNASDEKIFQEHRSWQIASDAVGAAFDTRLWTSGFERASTVAEHEYTANLGTIGAISNTTVRSGTYSLRTRLTTAGTSGGRYSFSTADSATGMVARAYIRVATLPSTEIQVLGFRDGSTFQASIRLDSSGNLKLWDEEDNVQIGSTLSSAISTNTWYRLELRYDFGTAAVSDTDIAASIDGNVFASSTTQNHANGVRGWDWGILATATGEFYWDDLALNNDAFAGHDNWVGEGKVVLLLPDGNGTNTSWGAGTGAFDYTQVDDPPITGFDDITTYVQCTATTNIDEYTLASTASVGIGVNDRIRLVEGWSRSRSSSATSSAHTLALYDGTNLDGTTSTAIATANWFTNDDTIPRNASVVVYNRLGLPYHEELTPADVDNFQIRLSTTDCTPAHQVTAVWALVEYVPAEGGRVFSSGFELNSGSTTKEWDSTAGTVSIDSTTKRSGTYALRASSLASGTEESVTYAFASANKLGPYYLRTYLYLSTLPSADNRIIELQDASSTAREYIVLTSSGTLKLYDEDGQVGSASGALSTGQWYRIEMKFDSSGLGANDSMEARIDGTNFTSASNRDVANGVTKLILGGNLNSEAQTQGDWYFDDVAVNYGMGSTQNDYPGAGNIVHLRPSGNGAYTAWAGDYLSINEISPDDLTSISTSTIHARESATYEDSSVPGIPSDADVKLVSVGVRTQLSAANTSAFTVTMIDTTGGQQLESRNIVTTNTTWFTNYPSTPRTYPLTAYTRPMMGLPWTAAALDSLEIGVRETSDSNATIRIATMWALVEYSPANITIEGTCDAYDQTTDCGDTGTVKYAVNGVLQAETQPTVSGNWTVSGVTAPANGDVVTVFIDGASDGDEAVAVTKYDGTGNITGIKLFKEHLTIGSDDNQTLTNADLSQYDNSVSGDEDIFFDVSAGNDLTVDSTAQSSQEELYILPSNTYQPASGGGADVNTHDIEIDGTFTADSNSINISGSWVNDNTFTSGTSAVTFTATSGTEIIDNTNATLLYFNDVVFGSGSSSATWQLDFELLVNGDLTIDFGTLNMNGEEVTVSGNFDNNASFDASTSTLYILGSGNSTIDTGCSSVSSCPNQDFYVLEINKSSPTVEVTLNNFGLSLENYFFISQGIFIQGAFNVWVAGTNAVTIGPNGTWSNTSTGDLTLGGTFVNNGEVIMQGNGATCGDADAISITSTVGATQRAWSGSGTFTMNDVSVQDQGGSAAITVYSGTSVSGNDTNWTFDAVCPAEPLISITESSSQIQIDVPDRYRMIMNLGDTNDYIVFQDRYEDDANPDTTHEIYGPWIRELGSEYTLRDDPFRLTEVVEVSTSRIKLRVTGKFADESGAGYITDTSSPSFPISVIETYTFTLEGVYIEQETYFGQTGFQLDNGAGTRDGVNWLMIDTDITDAAHDDTANFYYGNGQSESSASADGAFSASNPYVVIPGHGTGNYQSAFIGIQRTGWFDNSDGSAEWYWNEDETGEIDQLRAREFNSSSPISNQHYSKWFMILKPKADIDTETEREALYNDHNNPDHPTYTVGSEWNDHSPTAALGFNVLAANDHDVNVGNSSVLDFNDYMTLEAWIYRVIDTGGFDSIFSRGAGSGVGYQLGIGSSDDLEVWDGTSLNSTSNIIGMRKWQHIALVVDNNVATFYLNGDAVGSGAWSLDLAGANNLYLNTTNGASENFRGYLDEIRAWNIARTQQQIIDDMYHQIDPSASGLVGYWRFNENSGTTTYDLTDNDNDGAIDNATWVTGNVPSHYNEAEGAYTIDLDTNEASIDLDGNTNISTLLNGAVSADATTVTVDSTASFVSSGVAYTDGDKFSYTGTNGTQFTGVPATGLMGIIGHADNSVVASMNRHSPFYKFRNWRSSVYPINVSMESVSLVNGVDYAGGIKPFTYAFFAQDLSLYAPLESATVNVGTDLTNSGCSFVDAKQGFGMECNASSEDASFTSTNNIDYAKGTLEFWMKSATTSTDSTERTFFNIISGSDQFRLRKTTGNALEFLMHDGSSAFTESVTSSNYSWSPNEWVHIMVTWDDSASSTDQQRIIINRVEPTHTDSTGNLDGSLISPGTTFELGNDSAGGSVHCNCILDEFYIFDLNGSGTNDEFIQLAAGGNTAHANEYLNDSSADYTFDFNDDDASNRGEYIWLASDSRFQGVNTNLTTNGSGSSLNFDWEYWDGNSWEALTISETDTGASEFSNDGNFYYDAPGNWLPYAFNGSSDLYFIRGHLEGGTYSTDPVEDQMLSDIIFVNYFDNLSAFDQTLEITSTSNTAPNSPTSLSQTKTNDAVIAVADWTDETSVKFTASASDTDNPDTLYLCIEADQLGTGFSNTEDSCGSGVAYSGSPVTVTHTLAGLTQGAEYHWQARVKDTAGDYSAWVSFSTNAETDRDFGIDNTAPATGTVYDGIVMATDADYNDGSLTKLFGNWSGVTDTQSRIEKYQYAIGTTAGGTDIVNWTDKAETGNIFNDSFESSDLTSWDTTVTNSGNLTVTSEDSHLGLYSMKPNAVDTNDMYVEDNLSNQTSFSGRFYINVENLTPVSSAVYEIGRLADSGGNLRGILYLQYSGGNLQVQARIYPGPQATSYVNLNLTGWNSIEYHWEASASSQMQLWVNGTEYTTAAVNNSGQVVARHRVGFSSVDSGTSGYVLLDSIASDSGTRAYPLEFIDQTIAVSGHLHTGQYYHISVRGVNNAGTTGTAANSDGLAVLPTLAFSVDDTTVDFVNLTSGNSWTDTQSNVLTTSTNAYNGYVTYLWNSQNLTNTIAPSYTIPNFSGSNATPITWTGTGFGYTTSDSTLSGGTADRFTNGGPKYAGFALSGAGDPVADHTTQVTGTTGAISNEQFTITYRITSDAAQAAGPYTTNIIYVVVPIF